MQMEGPTFFMQNVDDLLPRSLAMVVLLKVPSQGHQ